MTEQKPKNMQGKIQCPICEGKGTIAEKHNEYFFPTREPKTSRCLICDGSGTLGTRTKLPDGTPARTVGRRSLNVSAKRKPHVDEEPHTKHLISVTSDDPCYYEVFRTVRKHRKGRGEWDDSEEKHYVRALEKYVDILEARHG